MITVTLARVSIIARHGDPLWLGSVLWTGQGNSADIPSTGDHLLSTSITREIEAMDRMRNTTAPLQRNGHSATTLCSHPVPGDAACETMIPKQH
jgi:hypothetical protein